MVSRVRYLGLEKMQFGEMPGAISYTGIQVHNFGVKFHFCIDRLGGGKDRGRGQYMIKKIDDIKRLVMFVYVNRYK